MFSRSLVDQNQGNIQKETIFQEVQPAQINTSQSRSLLLVQLN